MKVRNNDHAHLFWSAAALGRQLGDAFASLSVYVPIDKGEGRGEGRGVTVGRGGVDKEAGERIT